MTPKMAPILIILFGIIFYVLGYLKEYEFKKFGDLNNLENELELENGNVNCDFDIGFFYLCNGYNDPSTIGPANNPTPDPPPSIVLKFIGIIFYVFGYLDECKIHIFGDLNNFGNRLEIEFENVNCNALCNGYDYPTAVSTTAPISNPTPGLQQQPVIFCIFVNEINNEINKNENKNKLVLKLKLECELFEFTHVQNHVNNLNGICHGIDIVYGRNNNENFYDSEYYCGQLSPSPTATTPAPIFCFNGNDTGVSRIDILQCIFGVYLCESNINNEIPFGMWYFDFFDFFFFF